MNQIMISTTVPVGDANAMRDTIAQAGGGTVGDYTYCSFSFTGKGRFKPGQNADPTIGKPGELQATNEERIEVICDEANAKTIANAIRNAHPYEEPIVVAYRLLDI